MTKVLTTQNAQITTATVEVKTLTISGKQVTQSVFRQLREVPLISEDGALNGVPWGYVNYHPNKCEQLTIKHLHVVWQSGVDLLRSTVDLVPDFDCPDRKVSWEPSEHHFYSACIRSHLHGEEVSYFGGEPIALRENSYYPGRMEPCSGRSLLHHGVRVWMEMSEKAFDAAKSANFLARVQRERGGQRAPRQEADFARALKELDEECAGYVPLDQLFKAYDAEVQAELERRKRHRDVRAAIAELPHLFIAV